jgi:hypothetical protein
MKFTEVNLLGVYVAPISVLPDVILAAGMTVTVQIDPGGGRDRQDVLSRQ